jgi:acylphosphatase
VICRRCIVSGRVQGVFFRASTQAEAVARGIRGHARNLPDGRVEVLACGEETAVAALCDWLRTGPPQAHVTDVRCADVEVDVPGEFNPR